MKAARTQLGLLVAIVLLAASHSHSQTPSAADSRGSIDGAPVNKPAEQVYANIKALNGVPYGEVVAGMQVMSQALGVDCDYCHTRSGDRDAEGNPNKDVARQMIRMVRDLNESQFGGRNIVTCNICHRGHAVPTEETALSFRGGPANHPTPMPGLPSVRQVLDKYVAAIGGLAALARQSSRIEEGELTIRSSGGVSVPIQIVSQFPDKRLTKGFSVSHLGNSAQATGVLNGAKGWMRESSGPMRLMFGWRRDAAQLEDLFNLPRRLESIVQDLRVSAMGHVDSREVYILTGHTEFLSLVELYFDIPSGLLLRIVYFVDTVAGRMPSQIDYSDYREIDGVRVPHRWEVRLVRGVNVAYRLNSVKHNVEVDSRLFDLPNPPPSLYR
jgi:hypothetical protein